MQKLVLLLSVFLVNTTVLANVIRDNFIVQPGPCMPSTFQNGQTIMGGTRVYEFRRPTAEQCAEACLRTPECRTFTQFAGYGGEECHLSRGVNTDTFRG